jgi:hypothetical protein
MSKTFVAPLFEGPIDLVGDIHGEIELLRELLGRLGYDEDGNHPKGRRLVFIGDLGDRGPDSPAVIECVRRLVGNGRAQCLLGNHELNLLRNDSKSGNRWFINPLHPEQQRGGEFSHCRPAPEALKPVWLEFFESLPLVLERDDLRVVHAAWDSAEINVLRRENGSTAALFRGFEDQTDRNLAAEGLLEAAGKEKAQWKHELDNESAKVPLLPALGKVDERRQMGNPVRVATSGVERLAQRAFWSKGKWRMCERVRWWAEYQQPVPVIIGHYWRNADAQPASNGFEGAPEMFDDVGAQAWVGALGNVYCVDFSAGKRYEERRHGATSYESHLAAMRWPERELWFESGRVSEPSRPTADRACNEASSDVSRLAPVDAESA